MIIGTVENIKQHFIDQIEWSTKKKPILGGQQVSIHIHNPIVLTCKELDFEITIGYYRSQLKNKELALTLFELFLDDVIKNDAI